MRWLVGLIVSLWPGAVYAQCVMTTPVDITHKYDAEFIAAGRRFAVDPDLGRAVTVVESEFHPDAVSDKGAKGLMQLMPDTVNQVRVTDPFNPIQSIYGGMEYLHILATTPRFIGNPFMVLVAYNAGPNRISFPTSSYRYASMIISVYWQIKEQHVYHGKIGPTRSFHHAVYLTAPPCPRPHRVITMRNGKLLPTRHYASRHHRLDLGAYSETTPVSLIQRQ